MTNYKLYYFNVEGRGELIRLILYCAGILFEDFRFEENEWPAIKPNMPFGQVPVLEVDGNMLAQSHTIARYLARKYKLAGENLWEQSQADMYVDCIYDLVGEMSSATWEMDAAKQKELFDVFNQEKLQPHVKKIEQHLIKNGGNGHLVGCELTWADIAYYSFFTSPIMKRYGSQVLVDAPHLKKLIELVDNVPNIKKYVENRPVTYG